jgi:dTDP-glucose 4,6-dehydratase
MRLLVIGGCGFVGSNFVRYILQHYGPEMITNVDALTTGRLANLDGVAESYGDRYEFLRADIADEDKIEAVLAKHQFFSVVHFAAESSGKTGTARLLEQARRHGVRRFLLVSKSGDDENLAAAEETALAAHRALGEEVVITRSTDNYGSFQPPMGFIPNVIVQALRGQPIRLSGDGSRMRDWLHVEDHGAALFSALLDGQPGVIYPLASGSEVPDIDVALRILEHLGKSRDLITVCPDQPQVSRRSRAPTVGTQESLAWKPRHHFDQGLRETVDWYIRNREWWEPLLTR